MSKRTAIIRKKPSSPFVYLNEKCLLIGDCLDYGCGRGTDKEYYDIDGYDPNWFPEFPTKKYDTIICNYVLNVVTKEEQEDIIRKVMALLNPNGKAYFTVRRDIKSDMQGRGCVQRSVLLDATSLYHCKGRFEMYVMDKE